MATLTIEQKRIIALSMPWVLELSEPALCDGIKWSTVAIRDIYTTGVKNPKPPRGLQPRSLCKKLAHFMFEYMTPTLRRDGTRGTTVKVCWWHLVHSCLYGDMEHEERTLVWLRNHHQEVFENISQDTME